MPAPPQYRRRVRATQHQSIRRTRQAAQRRALAGGEFSLTIPPEQGRLARGRLFGESLAQHIPQFVVRHRLEPTQCFPVPHRNVIQARREPRLDGFHRNILDRHASCHCLTLQALLKRIRNGDRLCQVRSQFQVSHVVER